MEHKVPYVYTYILFTIHEVEKKFRQMSTSIHFMVHRRTRAMLLYEDSETNLSNAKKNKIREQFIIPLFYFISIFFSRKNTSIA